MSRGVRFAAQWLRQQQPAALVTTSVKQMVQVCAHTSAWLLRQAAAWLITFTAHSCYLCNAIHAVYDDHMTGVF